MATIRLTWQRPLTRESGRELKASDIAGYALSHSEDGGQFGKLLDSPPDATSRDVENIGPGTHRFRLACFDKSNRQGQPFEGTIEVPDDTPPSQVLNLTLSIVTATATAAS
jgi:hypothetical protein